MSFRVRARSIITPHVHGGRGPVAVNALAYPAHATIRCEYVTGNGRDVGQRRWPRVYIRWATAPGASPPHRLCS
eukprot:1102245-Prymnesium_polylepis.1